MSRYARDPVSGSILPVAGGSSVSGTEIAYADWLQLTPEQKASGDYYIPDYPVNGSIMPVAGFDTTPTLNSYKPVTSDGIARSLQPISGSIQSISGQIGNTDISDIGSTVTGAISNIAPILLWTNESPDSPFASQYVDVLGIQSYREIIVEFGRANQTYGQARYTIRTGITYVMSAIANNYIYGDYREFIIRDNQVGFADGYYGKPSGSPMPVANDAAIPKYIYGIK